MRISVVVYSYKIKKFLFNTEGNGTAKIEHDGTVEDYENMLPALRDSISDTFNCKKNSVLVTSMSILFEEDTIQCLK